MKKWGLVVSLVYAFIILALLTPATLLLIFSSTPTRSDFVHVYREWIFWIIVGVMLAGQVVLMWLSVDTSDRRPQSRSPLIVSAGMTGFFLALVTFVTALALSVAIWGEDKAYAAWGAGNSAPDWLVWVAVVSEFLVPWIVWGILFYRLTRNATDPVTRAVSWLFRGSVLELLIAVPSHVIVRRRHDCCAPVVTGFGITSGIAIMLLSFGPSVLLLYKKRMEKYSAKELASK